ncbi:MULTISPECIES: twin-arginine translocase subunit TatC [Anaeromyxobacter]|uniref:twin-arginine translocase subunit TatC n=1 Tax=Anaeromyxobacter TaxID=161492 RepID=UPI001F5864F3|nr:MULTISPECIES: twin-arginine translocase subunit TatC [unclassified Anaeromyxobacter]
MSSTAPQLPPAGGAPEPEGEVRLTFMEHLRDLRKRLMHALLGVLVGMVAVGGFVEPIFHWLMNPVRAALPKEQQVLHYTSSIEPLMVYLKVAVYGGVFVAAPWVLWQVWQFIAPGLYRKEKRLVVPFLFFGTLLFYVGAAFCYFLVMPPAFPAMLAIAGDASLVPMLTMSSTLGLVLGMLLGFGVVFEVPVIIAFLALIGVVSADTLAKYRRIAIVVNTLIAAIITPTGDPLNLAMMAVPMILFYEIGIVLARILGKKKAAPAASVAKA